MRVLCLLPFALVACAHADGAADRQIEALRVGVDQTEADQDRLHQRGSMIAETPEERAARPAYPAAQAAAAPAGNLPRAVQIGEDQTANEDPNDPEARPEIRLQGNAIPSSRATRKSRHTEDEPTGSTSSSRKKRVDASETAAPKENR